MLQMFKTFSSCLLVLTLFASNATAHVVLGNLDAGSEALDSTSAIAKSSDQRATGEVDELHSGEISGRLNFQSPSRGLGHKKGGPKGTHTSGNKLRYPSGNYAKTGSGGGGGGGKGKNRGHRQGGGKELVQTVVAVNNGSRGKPRTPQGLGMDVSLLNKPGRAGSGAGGGGGASGGGGQGGRDGDQQDEYEDGNHPNSGGGRLPRGEGSGSPVSGTPEPTAMVVWAMAACCGYGIFRYTNKRTAT